MHTRIFSLVVNRAMFALISATSIVLLSPPAQGQGDSGYLTDPATGIVYRRVTRTVETPVVETHVQASEQTVYRPQTVTETRPQLRTVYTPVLQYKLEQRVYGRWNPFQQPSIGYEHVPHTTWEARNETVHHVNTRTQWIPEQRTIEVPKHFVRMQREQKVEYEPVGRVNSSQLGPPAEADAFASRLRPLDNVAAIEPFGQAGTYSAPRIAASTVGGTYADTSTRTTSQQGMPPKDLAPMPSPVIPGLSPLPSAAGADIANRPLPIYR
jgi:hypothetical protein